MAQLPNIASLTIDDAKITAYLLNATHPRNHGKARFFMLHGFTQANWQELRSALLDHPRKNAIEKHSVFAYGDIYEIRCSLTSPDSRNPCIRSFWAIEPPITTPKFITAYPAVP